MNGDKNIRELNNPTSLKQWIKLNWTYWLSQFLNFIVFYYVMHQAISEYLNHHPYYKILQFVGIAIQSIGTAIGGLENFTKKERKQDWLKISNINLLLQFLGVILYMFSALRGAYPDVVIQWTFYPWKNY